MLLKNGTPAHQKLYKAGWESSVQPNWLFILHILTYFCGAFKKVDSVAQLAEHLPFKERVLGSSPSGVTEQLICKKVAMQ